MKIQPQTIMVAIQCVNSEIKSLDEKLEKGDADNPAELEQLLVSYDLAANDLQVMYEQLKDQYGELPSYEELIKAVS